MALFGGSLSDRRWRLKRGQNQRHRLMFSCCQRQALESPQQVQSLRLQNQTLPWRPLSLSLQKEYPLLSLLKSRPPKNLSKRIPTALFHQNRRSQNLKRRRCPPLKGAPKRSHKRQKKLLRLTHGQRRAPHQTPPRSLQRRPRIKRQGAAPMRALRRMRPIFITQSLSTPLWRSGDNGKAR